MPHFPPATRPVRPILKLSIFGAFFFCLQSAPGQQARTTPAGPPEVKSMVTWTTTGNKTLTASFEKIDEQGRVILRGDEDAIIEIPYASLTPESRQRAQKLAKITPVSVLYLGDSMSLEGFGKRLDQSLRENPQVGAVWTYMACATHPLSWMKAKPFGAIKTFCGYWSIESVKDSPAPRELNEAANWGAHKSEHEVPKIETMLETLKPDVLIMQSGNNFFSIFSDHTTIQRDRHGGEIKHHVSSFTNYLATHPSPLRKFYWITPPQNGKVTGEIQQFVFDQIRDNTRTLATVIDSRTLTHYPYKIMGKDKEHFEGREMLTWADAAYAIIAKDLFEKPFASLPLIRDRAIAMGGWENPAARNPSAQPTIKVRATLLAKTPAPEPDKFAPYHEFMVGFQYKIDEVIEGKYDARKLLVMHPAYIRLKKQPLDDLRIGQSYELQVRELDKTSLWNVIRRDDASNSFDLSPYILIGDERRHPDAARRDAMQKWVAEKEGP